MTYNGQQLSTLPRATHDSFSFSVGQLFRRETTVFLIIERNGDYVILQNSATSERRYISLDALHAEYLNQKLIACGPEEARRVQNGDLFVEDDNISFDLKFAELSDASLLHAKTVIRCIQELRAMGHLSLHPTPILNLEFERLKEKLVKESTFAAGIKMKLSTIYSWSRIIDRCNGDWRAAIPNFHHRGGRRNVRGDQRANDAICKSVDALRQDKNARISYKEIHEQVRNDLAQSVPPAELFAILPSRSKIESRIKEEFTAYEICCRNYGEAYANKKFRSFYPRDRACRPLEALEFDDKDTRTFCVDERNGLPYGRAFVTSGLDQNTTAVVGSSTSEHHRSTSSALAAFANSVVPKVKGLDDYQLLETSPEFYGMGGILIFDNALYNHAKAMQSAVAEISNSMCAWAKPRTPTEKSIVEDFNGRMTSDFLSRLPGYGGRKGSKDELSNGLRSACLTIQQFRQQLHKWIYDVYSNTPREGGLSPRQKWNEGMRNTSPRLPPDLNRLKTAIAIDHEIRFRPDGILFTGLPYQSQRLIELRNRLGHKAKVHFRYNPQFLREIYVLDPFEKQYFIVPSVVPHYANTVSLYQHKLIKKMAYEMGKKNPVLPELFTYREKLKQLVSEARWSHKRLERRRARRIGDFEDETCTINSTGKITTEIITDLENQVETINDVKMETDDEGWSLPEEF